MNTREMHGFMMSWGHVLASQATSGFSSTTTLGRLVRGDAGGSTGFGSSVLIKSFTRPQLVAIDKIMSDPALLPEDVKIALVCKYVPTQDGEKWTSDVQYREYQRQTGKSRGQWRQRTEQGLVALATAVPIMLRQLRED